MANPTHDADVLLSETIISVLSEMKGQLYLNRYRDNPKYEKMLDTIILGFGSYLEFKSGFYPSDSIDGRRLLSQYKNGIRLFKNNFHHLWL